MDCARQFDNTLHDIFLVIDIYVNLKNFFECFAAALQEFSKNGLFFLRT